MSRRHQQERLLRIAERWVDMVCVLLPKRVANEEMGDLLEEVHDMVSKQKPVSLVYLKLIAKTGWSFVHSIGIVINALSPVVKASIPEPESHDQDDRR